MSSLSTASFNEAESHGFAVRSGRDARLVFRRAMRHSRRVRVLRKAIPVVVVLTLGATAAIRYFDPMSLLTRLPISTKGVVISGSKITMAAPKLSGYTNDSRRYEMTAQAASQDITKPNLIELAGVQATIETADKSIIDVNAANGTFDRVSGMLTLANNVKLTSSSGLEVRLEEATINTGTSDVVSEKPVEVQNNQMTIKSNRMEVVSGGEVVVFAGAVNVYLPASEQSPGLRPGTKP